MNSCLFVIYMSCSAPSSTCYHRVLTDGSTQRPVRVGGKARARLVTIL
jgi:hypothetical protein